MGRFFKYKTFLVEESIKLVRCAVKILQTGSYLFNLILQG
jgi:hypothetical protein